VSSSKGKDFRISTQPSKQNLYSDEFRFTLENPRGNPKETTFFIYSEATIDHSFVSSKLDPSDYNKYPLDVVVLNNETAGRSSRRVYVIGRSNYGPMISLDDHGNVSCCRGKQNFHFYAYNVTALGTKHASVYFNLALKRVLLFIVRLSFKIYEFRNNTSP